LGIADTDLEDFSDQTEPWDTVLLLWCLGETKAVRVDTALMKEQGNMVTGQLGGLWAFDQTRNEGLNDLKVVNRMDMLSLSRQCLRLCCCGLLSSSPYPQSFQSFFEITTFSSQLPSKPPSPHLLSGFFCLSTIHSLSEVASILLNKTSLQLEISSTIFRTVFGIRTATPSQKPREYRELAFIASQTRPDLIQTVALPTGMILLLLWFSAAQIDSHQRAITGHGAQETVPGFFRSTGSRW
jgi:hypothetical protein